MPIIPISLIIIYLNRFVGIDATLRLYGSLCLILAYLMIMVLWLYFNEVRNQIGRVVMVLVAAILLGGSGYFAYANINVYHSLSRMVSNQHVTYFSLVTMVDSEIETIDDLRSKKIGVIHLSDPKVMNSIDETLREKRLPDLNEMVEYNSPLELIQDLYRDKIDVMVIGSNFISIFSEQEQFRDIEVDTKILETFSIVREAAVNTNEPIIDNSFTVLLLGTNSMLEGNIDAGQVNTLMLMTVNLQNLSVTMTSVPRDSYVPISCFNQMKDKLSHSHSGGTRCVVETVENLFDLEIPHYVKINFRGMVELIDILGGITVDVPLTFSEQNSRRQFGEHLITVEKGLQTLNGEQALALARHRSTLPTGDLGRIDHQQLIFEAMIKKLSEEVGSINELVSLINVLGHNVETNISLNDLTSLVGYFLGLLPTFESGNPLDYIHLMSMVLGGQGGQRMTIWEDFPLFMFFLYQEGIADARRLMLINLGERKPDFKFSFAFDGFADYHRPQWLRSHGDDILPSTPDSEWTKAPELPSLPLPETTPVPEAPAPELPVPPLIPELMPEPYPEPTPSPDLEEVETID